MASSGALKKRKSGQAKKSTAGTKTNKANVKRKSMDYTFLVLVIILMCFGLVMVLSASAPAAMAKTGDSYRFFSKQLKLAAVGLVAMLVISRINYRVWKRWTKIFIGLCVVLLIAVLIPGIGSYYNGAWRWIPISGFQIQPSEFTKLAVAMYFAAIIENNNGRLSKYGDKITSFKTFLRYIVGLLPYIAWLGIIAFLMYKEPHLSGTIVIVGIAGVIMVVAGLHPGLTLIGGFAATVLGSIVILTSPNKLARVKNFIDPFADAKNMGWQVVQSLYAIGSGGLFGLGLGQSRQKYTYLPEPYNDFIFSVICEELGLLGAILVIMLFIGFIIRGIKIAMEAPDTFGSLMVVGIVAQVAIQAVLNIAVATSSVPNTGVSLPFFSYGGTAIVILMAEMGLVLSVSRYSRKNDAM